MENIYLGKPVYELGRCGEPEYHRKVGVIALDEKDAKKKIIDYCFELNPHTYKRLWNVNNLHQQEPVKGISLEQTVEVLIKSGIIFIKE